MLEKISSLCLVWVYILAIVSACIVLSSCTISLQNINTLGSASDLGDDELGASANVKTDLSIPGF